MENVELSRLERLWMKHHRRIEIMRVMKDDPNEYMEEWETIREVHEKNRILRYTLVDPSIPEFSPRFIRKVVSGGVSLSYPTSSKLCDACRTIATQILKAGLAEEMEGWPVVIRPWAKDYEIVRSSQQAQSCHFCNTVFEIMGNTPCHRLDRISLLLQPPFLNVQLEGQLNHKQLRLYAEPDSRASFLGYDVGFPILPEIQTIPYFFLLREWVSDCDQNHKNHSHFFNELPKLPTRVIALGEGAAPLSLLRTKGAVGKYIALSHCWGKSSTFSTTQENIETLYRKISLSQLPKTFCDAVEVTRELGIRYLWIDSLCIIQDDLDDWERESKEMENIFASAYCTIAATSARDCTEGFLRRQPIHNKTDVRSEAHIEAEAYDYTRNIEEAYGLDTIRSKQANSLPQCVRLSDGHSENEFYIYATNSSKNFTQDVEEGILNTRAWVYQERALSRRTIHFTKTQTYWECGSIIRSESLADWTKELNWLGDSNFPYAASRLDPKLSDYMFENIFTQYSRLDITNPEDRPIAIQGLESRLAKFYDTKAVYGIFERFACRSLLWQRDGDAPLRPITEMCTVPVNFDR